MVLFEGLLGLIKLNLTQDFYFKDIFQVLHFLYKTVYVLCYPQYTNSD